MEGLTEFHALPVVARVMEENDPKLQPLDISVVVFFDAESESSMSKFGTFFKTLGLKTFSYYDFIIERKPEKKQQLIDSFDINFEHPHKGFEALIANEVQVDRLWKFLEDLRKSGDNGSFEIPIERPNDQDLKKLVESALKSNKGTGWAARLLESCSVAELPKSVTVFLSQVYEIFSKPNGVEDTPHEGTVGENAEPGFI